MRFISHCVKSWGNKKGTVFLQRNWQNLQKSTFFRIFSIFVFRCMANQPLTRGEIAPAIAIKSSGLV